MYLELLWSFFQIGLFSIGGGYAAMPLIQAQVVDQHGWLTLSEFADIITISQMTPGPVAINSATFVGMRILGLPGAIVATLGCILPSCIIVTALAYFYFKYRNVSVVQGILGGLRPAVVALIASAGLTILMLAVFGGASTGVLDFPLDRIDWIAVVLFGAALVLLRTTKLDPMIIMGGAGVIGMVAYPLMERLAQ
ncbi:MAG TPA: chromate transporter [Candidatus Merdivicinus faecavium]|nr:chromate transporter [Candidatus Merdivicinus faecavium]